MIAAPLFEIAQQGDAEALSIGVTLLLLACLAAFVALYTLADWIARQVEGRARRTRRSGQVPPARNPSTPPAQQGGNT